MSIHKPVIAVALLCSGICTGLFAHNVLPLWILWLLTVGFFVGSAISPQMPSVAKVFCLAASCVILLSVVARTLPIHSIGWTGASSIQISKPGSTESITVTDPTQLRELIEFGEGGHFETVIKHGILRFVLHVKVDGTTTPFYVTQGGAICDMSPGQSQTVFIPSRGQLHQHLATIMSERR